MQRDAVGRVEKDEISRVDTSKETRSSSHGPCCRSQTSLADGRSWFLDDAYPDIESSAALHARDVRAFEPTAIIRKSYLFAFLFLFFIFYFYFNPLFILS